MQNDYNEMLYNKALLEFNNLCDRIRAMSGDEAIKHSYEIVIKEEILSCLENIKLDNKQVKKLYELEQPLDYLYYEWLNNDMSYMGMLKDTIEQAAEKM